ncbi:dylt-1, partial [Pristionchus pacificus]|uniref:Dylt-1 n=1 Tax=Pristionchus pacificus TaxID=54126 RepID=A0A8R1UYM7_PRIPA
RSSYRIPSRMASNGTTHEDLSSQVENNGHPDNNTALATLTQGEIDKIAKMVLDQVIGQQAYTYSESSAWNQLIVEQITTELVRTQRPYKFIVTSALLQTANGSGLNVSSVSYWNKATDLSFSYRWENKHMLAVVNVFAVAF